MTLPNRPHAIFSTFGRRTKPRHKANLAKELKMPTHNHPTPVDGILNHLYPEYSATLFPSTSNVKTKNYKIYFEK